MKNVPLSVMIENARGMMLDSFNEVIEKTNLPAYLLDGVVIDLLSEVRKQKNIALIAALNSMNEAEQEETESEEEK
jgi:hypothetical protein